MRNRGQRGMYWHCSAPGVGAGCFSSSHYRFHQNINSVLSLEQSLTVSLRPCSPNITFWICSKFQSVFDTLAGFPLGKCDAWQRNREDLNLQAIWDIYRNYMHWVHTPLGHSSTELRMTLLRNHIYIMVIHFNRTCNSCNKAANKITFSNICQNAIRGKTPF